MIRIKDKRGVIWIGAAPDTIFIREGANDAHLVATMIYLNTCNPLGCIADSELYYACDRAIERNYVSRRTLDKQ